MTTTQISAPDSTQALLTPIRTGISSAGGTLDVLVRVQAPSASAGAERQRTPLRLALVIDRSGSMDGAPLDEALRCASHIAARLTSHDQIAVVTYDNVVNVPVKLRMAGVANEVEAALAGISSGGSTDLFQGWTEGASQLEGSTPNAISRVVLLSDGQANCGETDPTVIQARCREWLAKGISTTTVGLGRGFNEELMVGMAKAGGGQSYYGQTAADLQDSFDEEFSLLQALCLRSIKVKLLPAKGVIVEPLGLLGEGGEWLPMTDLAYGSESLLLVRLHYTAEAGSSRDLLAATVQGKDEKGLAVEIHTGVLSLPVMTPTDVLSLSVDALVNERLIEMEFAAATREVRKLLNAGDQKQALELLQALKVKVASHAWLLEKVNALIELANRDAEMTAKELHYAGSRMNRVVAFCQTSFSVDETDSATVPAFLRRKTMEGKGKNTGR